MENPWKFQLSVLSFFFFVSLIHGAAHLPAKAVEKDSKAVETDRKPYIVYMGSAPESKTPNVDHHHSLLHEAVGDEDTARRVRILSTGRSFNAFAANLLPSEVKTIEAKENVVSVFPSTIRKLCTTRSWDFIKMPLSLRRNARRESDIIVGVMDSGIYIDAPSFDDKGFGPPPAKWRGICKKGTNFSGCNNKVIGARAYGFDTMLPESERTPADTNGHGTHTASTVAGVPIPGANLYGLGKGTARGGVPSARLAIYKVCWGLYCSDIDMLAAFDDAIADGVDLLSISIGGGTTIYFKDIMAIGSYHATRSGILVSCAAGNGGTSSSIDNVAPWMLTVGASGTDRQFRTPIQLGNGKKISGISVNTFPESKLYPLMTGEQASNQSRDRPYFSSKACDEGTMDEEMVKGKIMLCQAGGAADATVKDLGGKGTLIFNGAYNDAGFLFLLPTAMINTEQQGEIFEYMNSTKNATASILKSIEVKVPAPFMASFSTRGPNTISSNILKPDLVAPGVDILAAFSKLTSVTGYPDDDRHDVYNVESGTSMATPHVAAAAAYIKSFHPIWSPAAIKSALMTTATALEVPDELAELSYGAGQIDPTAALDPGLIYDISEWDYISFLCKEGYNGTGLQMVIGRFVDCSRVPHFGGNDGLNYPSIYMMLDADTEIAATFHRVVTNVGPPNSVYKVTVKSVEGLDVKVSPEILIFNRWNMKKSFEVRITGPPLGKKGSIRSASLEWSDWVHRVRSPVVAYADSN